jgi:hypothetical protein
MYRRILCALGLIFFAAGVVRGDIPRRIIAAQDWRMERARL